MIGPPACLGRMFITALARKPYLKQYSGDLHFVFAQHVILELENNKLPRLSTFVNGSITLRSFQRCTRG